MAVVSIVIACAAFAVACLSAWYTRRNATVNMDNRHDAQAPVFRTQAWRDSDRQWHLVLRLLSAAPLTRLTVQITDQTSLAFDPGQDGVAADGDPHPKLARWDGGLQPDGVARWDVHLTGDHWPPEIKVYVVSYRTERGLFRRREVEWKQLLKALTPKDKTWPLGEQAKA